jgi:hypothetical protein
MKIIAWIVALNLAVAFATPVVAAEIPTTKAECEQAGMRWKESANQDKCRFSVYKLPAPVRIVIGIIGLGLTLLGVIILYQEWRSASGLKSPPLASSAASPPTRRSRSRRHIPPAASEDSP